MGVTGGPCLEYASKVWWTGEKAMCQNLEKLKGTLAGN